MASPGTGPQGWGFLATGPAQLVTLAATSVTVTLTQFNGRLRPPTQVAFWNLGGVAAANSAAFVAFGSNTVTVSTTNGTPIVPIALKSQQAPSGGANWGGMEILTTGKSPTQYLAIGTAGTTTVYIVPGEGSR